MIAAADEQRARVKVDEVNNSDQVLLKRGGHGNGLKCWGSGAMHRYSF